MIEDVQTMLRAIVARYIPRVRAGEAITLEDYRRAHAASRARARGPVVRVETPLVMAINHGRWLADCHCRAGLTTGAGWPEARCFGCGAVYVNVVWPAAADRIQIVRALEKRPDPTTRNWAPTETWASLIADNLTRGLVAPRIR